MPCAGSGVAEGAGSRAARRELLHGLFASATELEQRFMRGLLTGRDPSGRARRGDGRRRRARREVRRKIAAPRCSAETGEVAAAAIGRTAGSRELPSVAVVAHPADARAVAEDFPAAFDWVDRGSRVEARWRPRPGASARRRGARVHAVPRDVTARARDRGVVRRSRWSAARPRRRSDRAACRRTTAAVPGDDAPFRSRELDVERALRASSRSPPFFFDVPARRRRGLDRPAAAERSPPRRSAPEVLRVPRLVTETPTRPSASSSALARGHEGVMVKSLDAPTRPAGAGRLAQGQARAHARPRRPRGRVGHGRRRASSATCISARATRDRRVRHARQDVQGHDRRDARLADRTAAAARVAPRRLTVYVRPELVVEVAFDGIQRALVPGGVALRFARSSAIDPTNAPTRPTRSKASARCHERGAG